MLVHDHRFFNTMYHDVGDDQFLTAPA